MCIFVWYVDYVWYVCMVGPICVRRTVYRPSLYVWYIMHGRSYVCTVYMYGMYAW